MRDNEYNGEGGRFGRDFLTGCLAVIFIGAVLFIGVPILVFLLKISFALVLPFALLVCLIILTAFLGRIINMFRKR